MAVIVRVQLSAPKILAKLKLCSPSSLPLSYLDPLVAFKLSLSFFPRLFGV